MHGICYHAPVARLRSKNMARHAKIWFRKATGWYMTTVNGKQHKLSKDKQEAHKAFHALLANANEKKEGTGGPRLSFRKLADLFLDVSKRTKVEETFRSRNKFLQSFC